MGKIRIRTKTLLKNNMPLISMGGLILLFVVVYFFNSIIISVHSGEGGVLYDRFFGGTVTDKIYGEGIHVILPWNRLYIYNVRVREVPYEFDVLSKNGLKLHLIISIRYHPEYHLLGVLHQKVGPDYVEKIVIPEIESVLRVIIGKIDAEEVYTTRTPMIEKAINEAVEQVSQRFVKVDDVIIKTIILPPGVEKSIQYKIEQKHLAEAFDYKIERAKREAIRKKIEASGIKKYNDIIDPSLTPNVLQWMAIQASLKLSTSDNSKVVVVGSGKRGLPIFGSLILDEPVGKESGNETGESGKSEKSGSIADSISEPDPNEDISQYDIESLMKKMFEFMNESETGEKSGEAGPAAETEKIGEPAGEEKTPGESAGGAEAEKPKSEPELRNDGR